MCKHLLVLPKTEGEFGNVIILLSYFLVSSDFQDQPGRRYDSLNLSKSKKNPTKVSLVTL